MHYFNSVIAFSLLIGNHLLFADDLSTLRSYEVLTELPVLSSDFHQSTFDQIWKSWPTHLRDQAESMSPGERTSVAYQRYGLTQRPDLKTKPLQYVVSENGNWTMNCFACHGGTVYGTSYPGAPNNQIALQTLTEEIRATKFRVGASLSRMDIGSLIVPLGTTNGTTNAVVFGMGLMNQRDTELNYVPAPPKGFTHHDMDAPPWWYFYKRERLYIDGFAEKGHRGLMQFMLIPENGPDFFREHEQDFQDVYAYISSLRPPEYPHHVQTDLAEAGRELFSNHCSECHGTYGDSWTYPNRRVPIEEIQTDPVRLLALNEEGRAKYGESWFAHFGEQDEQVTVARPNGYVAPPLDGIWASAPYFHNGSVPTLWGILRPEARPLIWRRTSDQFDETKVGFTVETFDKKPTPVQDVAKNRSVFDTRIEGKGNQGHSYGENLDNQEKIAVLEYLKTL